jgi:hypothetical protein
MYLKLLIWNAGLEKELDELKDVAQYVIDLYMCHTHFSEENRMHLICVPGSEFHTYDRLITVISQDIAQNVKKMFINFYYTHESRLEGLYMNNDNYEDVTPSSSSTGIWLVDHMPHNSS